MAMGTWRVDPVENRKLQVESGVDKSKLLGTPKPLEKKIAGGTEQSRDSLVIKCIEYIPPMKSAASGITFGGQEVADFKNKKTGEIKKDYVTSSKVDGLKWNFGQSAGQRSTSKKNEKVKYYVNLPIPQNVNDSHGVTWGESTMNLFELVGLQAAQNFMEDPGKAV